MNRAALLALALLCVSTSVFAEPAYGPVGQNRNLASAAYLEYPTDVVRAADIDSASDVDPWDADVPDQG